jgi:hypothetical protein
MNAQQHPQIRSAMAEPSKRTEFQSRKYGSREEGPWPEPSYIDPAINGLIGSIQSHMRKGVPFN